MGTHVILIDCPDQKGLIHEVSGVLYRHELNIDDQGEFVDGATNHFFMRTEVTGKVRAEKILEEIQSVLPDPANVYLRSRKEKKIALLVTKEWHCLGDLLQRHAYEDLNANIACVIGNHRELVELTTRYNVPFHYLPHDNRSRAEHEKEILEVLKTVEPEYLVLAKYMRILSADFIEAYPNRIINIHHSFLPAFIGAKPYHRAFERGVKIIGATAHFASVDLDEGPIISQDVIPVSHSKTVKQMIRAGRNVEKTVLANALQLVFEDRVFVHGNRTIIFD